MVAIAVLRAVLCVCLLSTIVAAFRCRVNSCIKCSSAPANCTVTHIDQYSYNYYCEAPSGCTPQNVPDTLDGYYCTAGLFIRNLNSTDFDGDWVGFVPSDTCEESSFLSGAPLRNNCLDITMRVSSLEGTNVLCPCKEDNCQDIINVTIIIDPPDSVSSSTLINGIITSSSAPSSETLSPSLPSSTIDLKSSSLTSTSTSTSLTSTSTSSASFSVDTSPSLIVTSTQSIFTSSVIPTSTGSTMSPSTDTTVTIILACKSIKCYK